MEFNQLIQNRRSTRAFTLEGIEEDKLSRALEAVRLAPSAGNLQAYEVYLVRGDETRQELARAAYGQDFVATAPVLLVFCANPARNATRYGLRGRDLYSIQDATVACTFAMLAVIDLGLATVWIGSFDPEEVRAAIGAPEEQLPVAMLPIGYAGEHSPPRPRRELSDLVHEI
jgi:nitroreductase